MKEGKPALLQSPRGMHDIMGNEYFSYSGFLEKAAEVALYYGFKPIETPVLEHAELFAKGVGESTDIIEKEMYVLKTKGGDHLAMRPEGTAGVMRAYIEHGMQAQPQPVMLYYGGPYFRHESPQKGRSREFRQFGLEVMGTDKAIMDAMVIKAMLSVIEEAGLKNLSVEVNSIGDKICRPNYKRELVNYYRKHADVICADCRNRIKTNPMRLLDCKKEQCQPVKEGAPDSISFLCAPCRAHFKEVLEHLEAMNISYKLNNNLVRGLDYYTRTVCEFFTQEGENSSLALGGGGRYDGLAKVIGAKKDIPSVGAALGVDRIISLPDFKQLRPRIVKRPKVFFIQLGFEAKLKSLQVIEILRHAHVPVAHSISRDGLSAQLSIAEKSGVPYAMILGQQEVLENSVLVRNMETRSQDSVKIEKLSDYLKKTIK